MFDLFRYSRCDATECLCEEGREKDIQDTAFEIILCSSCGSAGRDGQTFGLYRPSNERMTDGPLNNRLND